MKAIRVHHTGGPQVLTLEELPSTTPEHDEEPIRVELAGVNFIDVYHRRGQYPLSTPFRIGIEGIGISQSGERFFWLNSPGSYAQELNVKKSALTQIPSAISSHLSNEELLPLLCQGMTAHYLADKAYPIHSGESALVTAAAGGVGLLLVQILKSKGARVIALASSHERAEIAREHGADYVGVYSQSAELLEEATGGAGVNVVYDSVGKDYFDQGLEALAPQGMYVLYGGASGPVPPFDLMRLNSRSLAIRRPTLAHYTATASERLQRFEELLALRNAGSLRYPKTKVFPITEAGLAHQLIESRTYSGKIGIDPWKI